MAITVTPTLTRSETGTTLSWTISATSPHTSASWVIVGPNNYRSRGTGNSTSSRTETGNPGDAHSWYLRADAYNSSLAENEYVDRLVSASVLGNGVYVYTSGAWKPLNF